MVNIKGAYVDVCQHKDMVRSYHHGSVASAAVEAGRSLAREGGPSAVTAREVSRAVGVSVTALYRHFTDAEQLRAEVARSAREDLARGLLAAKGRIRGAEPAAALSRFRAIGAAYLDFAEKQPGLFAMAFTACNAEPLAADDPNAWEVLLSALQDLAEHGLVAQTSLERSAMVAWAGVHGLASISIDGGVPSALGRARAREAVLDGIQRAVVDPTPAASGATRA